MPAMRVARRRSLPTRAPHTTAEAAVELKEGQARSDGDATPTSAYRPDDRAADQSELAGAAASPLAPLSPLTLSQPGIADTHCSNVHARTLAVTCRLIRRPTPRRCCSLRAMSIVDQTTSTSQPAAACQRCHRRKKKASLCCLCCLAGSTGAHADSVTGRFRHAVIVQSRKRPAYTRRARRSRTSRSERLHC